MTTITDSRDLAAREYDAFAGLAPLVFIIFCSFTAIAMGLPVLSIEVHEHLGFGTATAGLVIGAQSVATVLTRHFAGTLADGSGPKTAVLLGLPLTALGGLAYFVAALLPASPWLSLAILVLGRLLLGVAESLFLTGTMSWGIARLGAQRTGKVMAWQGIAMYAAIGFGAPFGLAVWRQFGFAGVAIATILLPLVAALIAIAPRAVPGMAIERVPFHRVVALIWRPGLVLGFATAPFAAMAGFLALDYGSKGWEGAGLALSAFAASYILVRLFFAHLPDRMGGLRVACVSLIIECLGQIVLFAAPSATIAFLGATLSGIGFSLVFPAMGVEATRRVPSAQRGRAVGNFIAFFDVALGITGPAAGLLAATAGYASIFLAGAISLGLALLALLGTARMRAA